MLRPVVALLASSLLLASTSTRPAAGRIVFGASGASPGRTAIYTVNADGSDPRQLTKNRADHSPTWSPNGRWIALRTLNANGTNSLDVITPLRKPRRILARAALIVPEAWSPTSSAVLFLRSDSTTSASPPGLYIVPLRGGRSRPVVNTDGAT